MPENLDYDYIIIGSGFGGSVSAHRQVFGYKNMLVCDGSSISANPGVNPALTITAMSELAMSKIPQKAGK